MKQVRCPFHKKSLKLEDREDGAKIAVCRCKRDKHFGTVVSVKLPAEKKEGK